MEKIKDIDQYGNRIGLDLFNEDIKNEVLKEKELIEARAEAKEVAKETAKDLFNDVPETGADTTEDGGSKVWAVPVPSHNEYISCKDVDYSIYGGLLLMSNFDKVNNLEAQRYIYKNKFSTKELASLTGVSEVTIKRNMSKLKKAKIEGAEPLVTIENTPNGAVYKLNYSVGDKYYTTISSDVLKYLIDTANSNMIRLYVFFKVQLKEGRKQIQRDFICSSLGYKVGKGNNDLISNMTTGLMAHGLIKKYERVEFFYDEKKGREVPKTLVSYELVPEDKWREYKEGLTIKE